MAKGLSCFWIFFSSLLIYYLMDVYTYLKPASGINGLFRHIELFFDFLSFFSSGNLGSLSAPFCLTAETSVKNLGEYWPQWVSFVRNISPFNPLNLENHRFSKVVEDTWDECK